MSQSPTISVYQFKTTLIHSKPAIWRRIQVASDTTLGEFHQILQTAIGWSDSHLHQFIIQGVYYGEPDAEFEDEDEVKDEQKVELNQVVSSVKEKFIYEYDFGDSWELVIMLEKILPFDPEAVYPICLDGERACPPEDCGGIYGYYDFLEAIKDPKHPEHAEMLEWVGGNFDPEEFDLDAINKEIKHNLRG
ncbi:MAG: plasmid pRiA4b ORF-3 family protein [Planctomycetota bacterium]